MELGKGDPVEYVLFSFPSRCCSALTSCKSYSFTEVDLHHRTRPEAESRQFTFAKLLSSTARGGELELTVAKSGKVLLVSLEFASFIAASDFM